MKTATKKETALDWIISKAKITRQYRLEGTDLLYTTWFFEGVIPHRMNQKIARQLGAKFAADTINGKTSKYNIGVTFHQKYKSSKNYVTASFANEPLLESAGISKDVGFTKVFDLHEKIGSPVVQS